MSIALIVSVGGIVFLIIGLYMFYKSKMFKEAKNHMTDADLYKYNAAIKPANF